MCDSDNPYTPQQDDTPTPIIVDEEPLPILDLPPHIPEYEDN